MPPEKQVAVIGCLLGTAVGDALGLPFEAMSAQRRRRMYPVLEGHHFLFGRGMTSDDTEHTCLVAQALIVSAGEPEAFARNLAWRLRFWLLGLPAGIGVATLRAILKLWLGFSPHRSGVFSAGNGPAMRSALLGVCYGQDTERLRALVKAGTRITHSDPKAEFGAFAVALAAHMAGAPRETAPSPRDYYQALRHALGSEAGEFLPLVEKAVQSAARGETTEAFAAELGLSRGVSGYVYHTVPVALHAWFTHPADYRSGVLAAVRCGGDTDTTAAIAGALIGARVGESGIPEDWRKGLWEWPRSVAWMKELGKRLAEVSTQAAEQGALPVPLYGIFLRNVFFLLVVLAHGFRRLLPPY